jgi:hypothetical protein
MNKNRLDIEGDIDNRTGLRYQGLTQQLVAITKTAGSMIAILPGGQKINGTPIGRNPGFEFADAGAVGMRMSENAVGF